MSLTTRTRRHPSLPSRWRRMVAIGVLLLTGLGVQVVRAAASVPSHPDFAVQQRVGFAAGDDWEPATAADRFGHVYVAYKHYDVPGAPTCAGCDVHILVQSSADDGRTWSAPAPIAPGPVTGGQYDPQIAVDPIDGRTIWASFLQNSVSSIGVAHSSDFGATWSPLQLVSSRPPGLDKDTLVVRGSTVAVAYDDNHSTWASVSHDGGHTWMTSLVFAPDRVHNLSLSAGGGIDARGRLYFSWDSFDASHTRRGDGPVTLSVTRSADGGMHWTRSDVARSAAPPPCHPCGFAYLSAQLTVKVDAAGTVFGLWNGSAPSAPAGSAERIWLIRSDDGGTSWSSPVDVSDAPQPTEHSFPALSVGSEPGDVRIGWMDTRADRWNVFYRASGDGGRTLGPTTRLSGPVDGYPYLSRSGFALPYGDYFQLTVDRYGQTHAAFGEGPSYAGPGNIWVTREQAATDHA